MIEAILQGVLGGIMWAAINVDPWTGLRGVAFAAIWAYVGIEYMRGG